MTAPERVGVGARWMNGGGAPGMRGPRMAVRPVRNAGADAAPPKPERLRGVGGMPGRHPGRGGHDGLRPSPPPPERAFRL